MDEAARKRVLTAIHVWIVCIHGAGGRDGERDDCQLGHAGLV